MTDLERWEEVGEEFNWDMPTTTWWKRLPIIRHVRATYHAIMVDRHERMWCSMGALSSGYDQWVLWGIWHGKERLDD